MGNVFYRTYRPLKFADVVGQEHAVTTLANQLKNRHLGHAYLFTGSRGVGKTSVARILARAANCLSPQDFEPDNACAVCREMLEGKSLDLMEIDAASHTGVDNIREIIDHLNLPPAVAKYRTFIIDEVHMLSRGAFNALLKTLEEPPAHSLFILATTEVHKVPATVVSRTQRFDFRKLTDQEIAKQLNFIMAKEGLRLADEVVAAISQSVDGGLRDSLVLLDKAIHLAGTESSSDEIQRLLGITPIRFRSQFLSLLQAKDLKTTAQFLANLSEQGYNLEHFTKDFLDHLRTVLSAQMNAQTAAIAENILEAYRQLRLSPIPELPLLVAAVKIAGAERQAAETGAKPKNGDHEAQTDPKAAAKKKDDLEAGLEMSALSERWMEVLGRVKLYNQSLLAALKLAEPVGAVNGSITIAFPYKFHAETVNAAKNRLVIERALEEVFGKRIKVNCVTSKEANGHGAVPENGWSQPNTVEPHNDLIKGALEILGGEIVG